MIIPINIKALVRCSDGQCYPCFVLSTIINDDIYSDDYLPKYEIAFPGDRPKEFYRPRTEVKMNRVYFGGYDVKTS